jgi:hypothetical protein
LAMAEGFGSTLASRLWPPKREVPPPEWTSEFHVINCFGAP